MERIGLELRYEVRKHWLEQRTARSVLRDDVLVDLRDNRANNVLRRFVVILDPCQHLQVANDEGLLHIVWHLAIPEFGIRPDVDGPHFIRLRSDVATAEYRNERFQSLADIDGVNARLPKTRENVASKLGHEDRF